MGLPGRSAIRDALPIAGRPHRNMSPAPAVCQIPPDRHARVVDTHDRASTPGNRSPCGPEGRPGIHADRRRLPSPGAEGWRDDARGRDERRLSLAGTWTTTANGWRRSPPRHQEHQGRRPEGDGGRVETCGVYRRRLSDRKIRGSGLSVRKSSAPREQGGPHRIIGQSGRFSRTISEFREHFSPARRAGRLRALERHPAKGVRRHAGHG
jgi:hypothetical protein